MRDPKRIEPVLAKIRQIWLTYPDLRLGQLLENVFPDRELYYVEDDEPLEALRVYYEGAPHGT